MGFAWCGGTPAPRALRPQPPARSSVSPPLDIPAYSCRPRAVVSTNSSRLSLPASPPTAPADRETNCPNQPAYIPGVGVEAERQHIFWIKSWVDIFQVFQRPYQQSCTRKSHNAQGQLHHDQRICRAEPSPLCSPCWSATARSFLQCWCQIDAQAAESGRQAKQYSCDDGHGAREKQPPRVDPRRKWQVAVLARPEEPHDRWQPPDREQHSYRSAGAGKHEALS